MGKEELLPLDEIPHWELDFSKKYNFDDYSSEGIHQQMLEFEKDIPGKLFPYISDKLGFNPSDQDEYTEGLQLADSWSLINYRLGKADGFMCQALKGRFKEDLDACMDARGEADLAYPSIEIM